MLRNYIFSREQKKKYGVNYVKIQGNWIEYTDLVTDEELEELKGENVQVVATTEYVLPTSMERPVAEPIGIFINGRLLVVYSDGEIPDELMGALESLDGEPDEVVVHSLRQLLMTPPVLSNYGRPRPQSPSKYTNKQIQEKLFNKSMGVVKKEYKNYLDELKNEIDVALDEGDIELFEKLSARYNLAKSEM